MSSIILRLRSQRHRCIVLAIHSNLEIHTLCSIWSLWPLIYLILSLALCMLLLQHDLLFLCKLGTINLLYLIKLYNNQSILNLLVLSNHLLIIEFHIWSCFIELSINVRGNNCIYYLILWWISFTNAVADNSSLILSWWMCWLNSIWSTFCIQKAPWVLLLVNIIILNAWKLMLFLNLLLVNHVFDTFCYLNSIRDWSHSNLSICTTDMWCLRTLLHHVQCLSLWHPTTGG